MLQVQTLHSSLALQHTLQQKERPQLSCPSGSLSRPLFPLPLAHKQGIEMWQRERGSGATATASPNGTVCLYFAVDSLPVGYEEPILYLDGEVCVCVCVCV